MRERVPIAISIRYTYILYELPSIHCWHFNTSIHYQTDLFFFVFSNVTKVFPSRPYKTKYDFLYTNNIL